MPRTSSHKFNNRFFLFSFLFGYWHRLLALRNPFHKSKKLYYRNLGTVNLIAKLTQALQTGGNARKVCCYLYARKAHLPWRSWFIRGSFYSRGSFSGSCDCSMRAIRTICRTLLCHLSLRRHFQVCFDVQYTVEQSMKVFRDRYVACGRAGYTCN